MLRRAVGSIKISRAIVNLPPFLSLSLFLLSIFIRSGSFVFPPLLRVAVELVVTETKRDTN